MPSLTILLLPFGQVMKITSRLWLIPISGPTENEKAKDFEARYAEEDMNTKAMRAMLISNGILTQDGGTQLELVEEAWLGSPGG